MKTNDEFGNFNGPGELRIVRVLPGPIERVWEFLTDPEKRARWFAGGPMEQKAGGKMRLDFRHQNIAPKETPPKEYQQHHDPGNSMTGIILRCEPPRLLSFTFGGDGDSEVTFELTPQDKEVILVLTHRARGEDLPFMTEFGAGWHTHLMHLIALLENAPAPAFWPVHGRLKTDYEKLRTAARAS